MRKNRGSRFAFCACAPVIEHLEKRALLSAVLGADGTLTVAGTPQADTISVQFVVDAEQSGYTGFYTVKENGTTSSFDAAKVKKLVVTGGDGNDSIQVGGNEENDTSTAQMPVNAVVTDGNGNDTISSQINELDFLTVPHGIDPASSVTVGNGNDAISETGGTTTTLLAGNGNDTLNITSGTDTLVAGVTAGNGNDSITGSNLDNSSLTINANVGTGRDTFNNGNTPAIEINATTSDGQLLSAYSPQTFITGHITTNGKPLAGAVVFVDSNNDGVPESNETTSTTDSNGNYLLQFTPAGTSPIVENVRVLDAGYAATPGVIQQSISPGMAFSSDNFSLTRIPTAGQPTLFGTSGSYNNQGNTIAKAVDGNLTNYFDAPTPSGAFVALDYGSPQTFSQISYAPRFGFASRMVGGVFQGSNSADFSNATTLYTVTTAPASGVFTTVNVTNTTTFRYVRYLGPANSNCNVAEMQFAVKAAPNSVVLTSDGTLTITGTPQADTIAVNFFTDFEQDAIGGTCTVKLNGNTTVFSAANIKNIVVNGLDGDDNVNIQELVQNDTGGAPPATTVNVAVTEGAGNNIVNVYLQDAGIESQGGVGPSSTVLAGNGNNQVLVYGSSTATVTVGSGNNTLTAGATDAPLSATFNAGNGDNNIIGGSSGDSGLTVQAFVGTGQNTFSNGDDPDIQVYGITSDGQSPAALRGFIYFTGTAKTALNTPVAGATVFLDADNNGVLDPGEISTTTNSQGIYLLVISSPLNEGDPSAYNLQINAPGYTAVPPVQSEQAQSGLGFSGENFVLTSIATASHPTLFGTSGSYNNQGNTIANAVDGNLSTFFDAPIASGAFVALDYGSPQYVEQISYAPRPGFASRMVGGLFQGSNSADFSNAVTIYSLESAPAYGVLTVANIQTFVPYRYIRYIGPVNGYCNIAEMKFGPTSAAGAVTLGSDGTLTIDGTSAPDTITLNFGVQFNSGGSLGAGFGVILNGVDYAYESHQVTKVVINGGDGNDSVNVSGYENFDTASTGTPYHSVNLVVNEGNGNDTISVSDDTGPDLNSLPPDGGPTLTITAGDGSDNISIADIPRATVNAGNGDDSITGSAGDVGETDIVNVGNGDDTVYGQSAGDSSLDMYANTGTGHDTYRTNNNDVDIAIFANTSDGQTSGTFSNQDLISGRVTIAGSNTPVTFATVFVDANNNGILDPGELSTTDFNSVYSLEIPGNTGNSGVVPAPLRIIAPGYTAAPAVINEGFDNSGEGVSGDDFVLTPITPQPTVFGTAGSYQNNGNTIAKAVDGNLSTYFDAPTASGAFVALDYGSAKTFTQISYAPRPGLANRMVGGLFQGSNSADFSNAVTLYKITAVPVAGQFTTVNISGTYRYVRYIGPANSYCNIAEMKFVTAPTKLTGTAIGTAGSYQNQGNTIAKAFDGILTNYFDGPDASGDWVGLDLGSAQVATSVKFAPRVGFESRMVGGMIQASNSATFSSGVVTLATITTKPAAGMLTTLPLNNTMAYRYYRYVGPANSNCDIAELEFDG